MYNINVYKLGFDTIEPHRRKPKFLAFLYVMLFPFKSIMASFNLFRSSMLYELSITAQVNSLEYHLNNIYGLPYVLADRDNLIAAGTIIYIEDTSNLPFTWVDNQELFFASDGLDSFVAGQTSFDLHNHYIVRIPNTLAYNAIVLRSEIDKFNHVNRKFEIQNY